MKLVCQRKRNSEIAMAIFENQKYFLFRAFLGTYGSNYLNIEFEDKVKLIDV